MSMCCKGKLTQYRLHTDVQPCHSDNRLSHKFYVMQVGQLQALKDGFRLNAGTAPHVPLPMSGLSAFGRHGY